MKNFRDVQVWQKAHKFTLDIYKLSKSFPGEEKFGLTSQLRLSASSIPTNIAEGCGYKSDNELRRFLQIAMGSASESEYTLLLAYELSIIQMETYQELNKDITEIKRMLTSFINKLYQN